jgi:hypothetical protein
LLVAVLSLSPHAARKSMAVSENAVAASAHEVRNRVGLIIYRSWLDAV